MTDNQKAEAFALKQIRKNGGRLSQWVVSHRTWDALNRLEKRKIIKWTIGNYPVWKFKILKREGEKMKAEITIPQGWYRVTGIIHRGDRFLTGSIYNPEWAATLHSAKDARVMHKCETYIRKRKGVKR